MAIRRTLIPDLWQSSQWAPSREIARLHRDIDQMFDSFLSSGSQATGSQVGSSIDFSPPCDVDETDTHFLVSFDLPGVSKNDVKIEVRDNQLLVSGERKEEHKEEKKNRVSIERIHGAFQRAFALPARVDADRVEALYENGVLKIAIPKSEVARPKQIEIKESKEGGFFQKFLKRDENKSEKAA